MPTIAVSPLYIVSSARAATGLTQPVPVVGTMTSSLRSKAWVTFEFAEQHRNSLIVGVGGVQAGVDADGFLGGRTVDLFRARRHADRSRRSCDPGIPGSPMPRKRLGCPIFHGSSGWLTPSRVVVFCGWKTRLAPARNPR